MDIHQALDDAINHLVSEFLADPYRFFTEADAVARFSQILAENALIHQTACTKDRYDVPLVHREYPTFFRFSDKNPIVRSDDPLARRGHYDVVILNREFVRTHNAAAVANRDIKEQGDTTIPPFQGVIEFKLDNRGWSAGRAKGAIDELGKLRLSNEATLRYFVVLMRYTAPTLARWEKYWPIVSQAIKVSPGIASVVAVSWLSTSKSGAEIHRFGNWVSSP